MNKISHVWNHIQRKLFPFLEEELDPLTKKQKKLVAILELIRIEEFVPAQAHEALIKEYESERLVGHISRDATDIAAREKPAAKAKKKTSPKRRRGRPKKGEARPAKEPTRLEKQLAMSLDQMLDDLPKLCDWGTKKKNGKTYHWKGYKLHVDWADGEIPVSVVLTSASTNDSQAPLR